jgi:hypothetical protein
MRKILFAFLFFIIISSTSFANPGNYTLRILAGPSFAVSDWEDQFRIGGEFSYDLGYSMNIGLLTGFGISSNLFRFQMIPGFSYNYLYLGPAAFHALAGFGLGFYESDSALDTRLATGVSLPLGDFWEAYSDVNYIFAAAGTPGTPATFDWQIGFGFVFK